MTPCGRGEARGLVALARGRDGRSNRETGISGRTQVDLILQREASESSFDVRGSSRKLLVLLVSRE